jgi:Cupin-like domain
MPVPRAGADVRPGLRCPTLLPGLAGQWPACRRWSLAYLAEVLADTEAAVVGVPPRHLGPREYAAQARRVTVRFSDFLRKVDGQVSGGPVLYLTEYPLDGPAAPLAADVPPTAELVRELYGTSLTRICLPPVLFVGPGGTLSHLHYDIQQTVLVQIIGRKVVTLFPPSAGRVIGGHVGRVPGRPRWAELDVERPDPAGFPHLDRVRPWQCVLRPGDAIVIPIRWWHHVRALDPAVSVNYGWRSIRDLPALLWDRGRVLRRESTAPPGSAGAAPRAAVGVRVPRRGSGGRERARRRCPGCG